MMLGFIEIWHLYSHHYLSLYHLFKFHKLFAMRLSRLYDHLTLVHCLCLLLPRPHHILLLPFALLHNLALPAHLALPLLHPLLLVAYYLLSQETIDGEAFLILFLDSTLQSIVFEYFKGHQSILWALPYIYICERMCLPIAMAD